MARARRRAQSEAFVLYGAGAEMRPIGRCSWKRGEAMLAQGKAVPVVDGNGAHLGYQVRTQDPLNGTPSAPVAMVITQREMELVAGQAFAHGRSRTAGMSEPMRLTRRTLTGRPLPAEDDVERAVAKLQYFAPRYLAQAS